MPNDDYIKREYAIMAMREYSLRVEHSSVPFGIMLSMLERIQADDVVPVVRCRDCKWKPTAPEGITEGFQVEFPYEFDNPCPCKCGDGWYSEKPHDDFFCAYGKKEEDHE